MLQLTRLIRLLALLQLSSGAEHTACNVPAVECEAAGSAIAVAASDFASQDLENDVTFLQTGIGTITRRDEKVANQQSAQPKIEQRVSSVATSGQVLAAKGHEPDAVAAKGHAPDAVATSSRVHDALVLFQVGAIENNGASAAYASANAVLPSVSLRPLLLLVAAVAFAMVVLLVKFARLKPCEVDPLLHADGPPSCRIRDDLDPVDDADDDTSTDCDDIGLMDLEAKAGVENNFKEVREELEPEAEPYEDDPASHEEKASGPAMS